MCRRIRILAFTLIFAALSGCATPVAPSGGPPDETPPEVVATTPAEGAVNVDADAIRITFSEYVQETSLPQALSISPGFGQRLEYSWSGRSVVVRFPEPLRENTTYVVTLDTNLRDAHSVALRSPIVLAFSTGPTISSGVLSGRVVDWIAGGPIAGVDVLAYALPDSAAPDSLPDRPAYRTQTGTDGDFSFEYLTEQFYYVAALDDVNRNLRPDPQEDFAPPPAPAIFASSTADASRDAWIFASIDTIAPAPVRVQSLARSRHILRFSEPVEFVDRDPSGWTLADSASGEPVEIRALYLQRSDRRQVYFTTDGLDDQRFEVVPTSVTDTSGNAVRRDPTYFSPAAREDTVQTRFIEFLPEGATDEDLEMLPDDVEPGMRFNTAIDTDLLETAVSVTDSTGTPQNYVVTTQNGTDYDFLTEPPLGPDALVSVAVDASSLAGPDSVYRRDFRRISADATGEISGIIETKLSGPQSIIVRAIPTDLSPIVPSYVTSADSNGLFVFPSLPAGSYRIRAFVDDNLNGTWDPGLLMPYTPGEEITWRTEPARVRARWETALPDTLHIPHDR